MAALRERPLALLLAGALCLLLGPQAAARSSAQNGAQGSVAPIQKEGDFFILNFSQDPQQVINLEEFVSLCQEATGLNFTYSEQTQQLLRQSKVFMTGTKRVPQGEFYEFFQIEMFINDFVCVEVGPPHISVVLIQNMTGQRAGALRQKTVYVGPDRLEEYADQPATLVTTVLHLPNVDVRQLSTSLRGLLTDTNTQSLIAAGENSVILQGFGSYVVSLAQLLRLVDKESAIKNEVSPVFDVLPLEFAAPEDVADLLEQLLESNNRGGGVRRVQGVEQQGVSGVLGGGEIETKILVDGRTQSLLVMAMPDEMPRIKDLVARLDVDVVEPERNFHVYSLQNVNAEDIAEVLDEFLSDAERLTRRTGGTGGRAGGQAGGGATGGTSSSQNNEVIVVPDPGANALLIAANKTRYEEVLELIRQLDRRQDQVLIETALIELTGTDFRDIGVELAFADTEGDGSFGATNFGLSQLQDLEGDDGVPDTRVPILGNGITAGILSSDEVNLPFLIAAVQRKEGANVLNVPSVLVNNNGTARVVTLDEQPTTTITATGGGAGVGQTQENFREFEEAGVTLEISPSISASRYLRLDISLVVSTFTGSFSENSAVPPPRITREIATTVNVPDGDTMVIGGIITDNLTETSSRTPWVSDIPILGWLFRRDSTTNTRTTLYFFVTPHIMRDRDFADLAEISYYKKLDAAEIIGQDRVRIVDPDFGAAADEYDLESFQIPLYRSPSRGEVDAQDIGMTPERRRALLQGADDEDDTNAPN